MFELYEINVYSFNATDSLFSSHKVYERNYGIEIAKMIGDCENVTRVVMVSSLTGEIIIEIKNNEIVWEEK